MAGVNRVTLLGHLGKDPELKTFTNGGCVANVSLATSERWKGKDGQMQEHTEWHNLVFNDRLAEIADKYLAKGSKIYIEGKIRSRSYDKDGEKRYITEIRVSEMQMLDGKPQDGGQRSEPRQQSQRQQPQHHHDAGFSGPDDDIPF